MEQDSKYYDNIFSADSYKKKPEDLPWFPLWAALVQEIKGLGVERVIDLGCGTGHFAEMLHDELPDIGYSGWDFSEVAIKEARERCPHKGFAFAVGDLRELDFSDETKHHPTAFVCSEVLEHIEDDIELLKKIPEDSPILITVPDFDDPGHVRKFSGTFDVFDRYDPYIEIELLSRLPTGRHFILGGKRRDGEPKPGRIPGITLVMQVCDEEVGIGKAIDSVKDEVTMSLASVDDTTVDNTQVVAEEHGALTYKMKWENDFAGARNALDAKTFTEWVLVLDGHEYLKEGSLKKAIKKFPDAAAIECKVEMDDGKRHVHYRLYKPEYCHWENSEHNILKVDGDVEKFHEMVVKHNRHEGQSVESRIRRSKKRDQHLTLNLYKKATSDPTDTRSMFYLAQQHRDSARWEAAYYWYDRYCRTLGGNQWKEELFQAHLNAARAALALNDLDGGGTHGERASKVMPERGEGWAVLGDAHYRAGNFGNAYTAYDKANKCPMPKEHKLWVDENLHQGGYKLLDVMSMCCWRVGNYKKGKELCEKLLKHPKFPDQDRERVEKNLEWHNSKLKEPS